MARFILGKDSTPEEVRFFITHRGGRNYLKTLQGKNGKWYSPITGEAFDTYYQLTGHIGARMRNKPSKTPLTEDRKGYIKAIRRGEEPTDAQRRAHKEYIRDLRSKRRRVLSRKKSEPVRSPGV